MNALLKWLDILAELPENWDGYNGSASIPVCIQNTKTLLKLLDTKYTDILDPKDISPSPYGTIELEWENISIEIGYAECTVFPGGRFKITEDFSEIIKVFKSNFK